MSDPAPWERQSGEPDRAWAAFTRYRDLDPGERSLNRSRTEPGPALSELKRWSGRWRWVERVRAWDRHVDDLRRSGAEEVHVERARTGRELAARVRAVLDGLLDRPDLDTDDVLKAAKALRELAVAAPEPLHAEVLPALAPPAREPREDDEERVAGVLAVLERAGVIMLPPGSGEVGRHPALVGEAELPEDDDVGDVLPLPLPRSRREEPVDEWGVPVSGLPPDRDDEFRRREGARPPGDPSRWRF